MKKFNYSIQALFYFLFVGLLLVTSLSCSSQRPSGSFHKEEVCPFTNASRSPEEIANLFLSALQKRDEEAIWNLRVTKDEYFNILWPPYEKIGGGPPNFSWSLNFTDSKKSIGRALADYGGRKLTLVRVYFAKGQDQTRVSAPFVIWRDFRIVVKDEQGLEGELNYINTVIEMNGCYKVCVFHS
ncbi:MAG TPA: hypothetical protein VMT04_09470 [Terriglobales bacterium]|nr:hypothetical protein [Terriglobales bacterium]